MKKNVSLLAAVLMSTTILVGATSCKDDKNPSSSETNSVSNSNSEVSESSSASESTVSNTPQAEIEFDTTTPVTISFYSTMGTSLKENFDPYIAEFNKIYPNIKVDHTAVGGYDEVRDKIKTELGVENQGPNLAYCYPDHVALYNMSRKVQTLDKFIDNTQVDENGNLLYGLSSEQKADFVEGFYNEGKGYGDNLMYSLPFVKSTEVLYYNKTEFDKLGLSVPTHWFKDDAGLKAEDSMEYVCEALLKAHPDCVPLGYDSEANWFITMTEQYGYPYTSTDRKNHFLFENDQNKAFVGKFKEWYQKGYVTTQKIEGAYTSTLFVNTDSTKKTSYMSIGSSAGAKHQAPDGGIFEVGISSIPQVNAAKPKVISQGPSICIFKKSNQQEVIASWLFLRYITTTLEVQGSFSMASGYVPVIQSINNNAAYKEFLDGADGYDSIAALSAKVCVEQSHAYFTSPAFVGSSDARDQVGELMVAALTGTKTIDQAFKEAIDECNAR